MASPPATPWGDFCRMAGYFSLARASQAPTSHTKYTSALALTKKWTLPVRNWGQVYAELAIMDPGRLNGDQPSGGRRLSVRSTPTLTERRDLLPA